MCVCMYVCTYVYVLIEYHSKKMYGEVEVQPHIFLNSKVSICVCSLTTKLHNPTKAHLVPTVRLKRCCECGGEN
jgi:hypothetical protein